MRIISLIIFLLVFLIPIRLVTQDREIVIDSDISLAKALSGIEIPQKVKQNLTIISVEYFSFDGRYHRGQLIVNKEAAKEVKEIFEEIKRVKFPIAKVIPVSEYGWSDEESMKDNNTSAFNYRTVAGSKKLSSHSLGKAIDINPLFNPQIKNKKVIPAGAEYIKEKPGTILPNSAVVKAFRKRGWMWGGYWKSTKDYQHFEKK